MVAKCLDICSWSRACCSCFCCWAGDVLAPASAAVAAAVAVAMACGDSCLMTEHVTSVELDKNRNLKYHPIQSLNALLFRLLRPWKYVARERELQHESKVDPHYEHCNIKQQTNKRQQTNCAPATLFNVSETHLFSRPTSFQKTRGQHRYTKTFLLHDANILPNRCTGQGVQHVCKFHGSFNLPTQ